MSESQSYFIEQDGTDIGPVDVYIAGAAGSADPPYEFFLTATTPIEADDGTVIVEQINGVDVGSLTLLDVTASTVGRGGFYTADGSAGDVTITGEFDAFPCFATDTSIATADGAIPVEALRVGDAVALAAGGTARVKWIGRRRQIKGDVIRIRRHALGAHTPERDLIVSSDHGMFIDQVLVQAGALVNGETIMREQWDEVVFWHVELDAHGILLAEGAAAESYLDTGNRAQFANCPLTYDPIAAPGEPCAEMVLAGARLEAIRARLDPVLA